jgi:hypothetical protein
MFHKQTLLRWPNTFQRLAVVCRALDLHNLHLKGNSPVTIFLTALDPSHSLFVDMQA